MRFDCLCSYAVISLIAARMQPDRSRAMLNSRRIASRWVCLVASSLMTSAAVAATTLTFQQFELPLLSGLSGWQFGAQGGGALSVVLDPLATLRGSAGSLRGTYPTATGGT